MSNRRASDDRVIPVSEPFLDEAVKRNVMSCLDDGWISSDGPFVAEFERRWASYCGMAYGVAVCNGTAALELAMSSLDLAPGDEVILPTFTIISCVIAILEAGAVPVLVDSDPDTWCMDVTHVGERIGPRTRAIMPVHIYGHPVDMGPLWELASRHDLVIVEDAAEAHGATYRGQRAGSLGDVSCFSFYANKIVTTGEGGMVLTKHDDIADRLRSGRNLGFGRGRRFEHDRLGHNYRLSSMQAAVGLAQLDAIEEHLSRKRRMAAFYEENLTGIRALQLPMQRSWATNVYWMYGVVLTEDVPFDASVLAARLRDQGIETRPFFLGMHEQPVLRSRSLFAGERYPVAERIARRGLYLPSGLGITRDQQERVCAALTYSLSD